MLIPIISVANVDILRKMVSSITNLGHINDENETSVNLILEKKFYLYDGRKWILKENVKYLYDKK